MGVTRISYRYTDQSYNLLKLKFITGEDVFNRYEATAVPVKSLLRLVIILCALRDETIDDKLVYIPNADKQNYRFPT